MKNKKKQNGFNLIELMIVLIIIGILLAVILPNFLASQDRAKISAVKGNMKILQNIVEIYNIDHKGYPETIDILKTEAINKGYWKQIINPFTHKIDEVTDLSVTSVITPGGIGYMLGTSEPIVVAKTIIFGIKIATTTFNTALPSRDNSIYSIVGTDQKGDVIKGSDNKLFVFSNGIPSAGPTTIPSASPSTTPTKVPSVSPSASPSASNSAPPSASPSASNSPPPSASPSASNSAPPSASPSASNSPPPSASPSASNSDDDDKDKDKDKDKDEDKDKDKNKDNNGDNGNHYGNNKNND